MAPPLSAHTDRAAPAVMERRIRTFAETRFGLMITRKDWPHVCRRVEKQLGGGTAGGRADWQERIDRLGFVQEEYHRLIEAITVGETYLFRSARHFEALRHILLERVARSADRPIRMWSAGCSSGDEAYSMAIVAREVFGARASQEVDILATDICETALEAGRAGIYGIDHFRECPPAVRDRHFHPVEGGGGDRQIDESLRALVRFQPLNLISDALPLDRAIIFCRHVSLYMTEDARKRLWSRLAGALSADGTLFVSDAEAVDCESGLGRIEVNGVRVFRKARAAS